MISSEFLHLLDELASRFESGKDVSAILHRINNQQSDVNGLAWERDDLMDNWRLVSHLNDVFLIEEQLEDYYDSEELLGYSEDQVLQWCENRLQNCFETGVAIHFMPVRNSTIAVWAAPAGHSLEFSNLSIDRSEQHHIQDLLAHSHIVDSFKVSGLGEAELVNLYGQYVTTRLIAPNADF